jgi:NAD(P)-dependent dehydrogenase (short-subunit alcohol dehydrogenase family)
LKIRIKVRRPILRNEQMATLLEKTVLITGATTGIGRQTALGIARQGFHMTIVGRDPARTRETVEWIKRETGNGEIDSLLADLSSQAAVIRLAQEFRQMHPRLDVLVNNAGGIFTRRETTVDGLERTWALNHLGYFLLTLELLDLLKASAPARIVNVASAAHTGRTIDFDDLQSEKNFSAMPVYGRSKLANVLFTYALARRLDGTGVTVNCLHPGVVATGFGQDTAGPFRVMLKLAAPFLLSPEKGAATSVYLASSPDVEGITGQYFAKCKPIRSAPNTYDVTLQEKLWAISLQQVRRTEPHVTVAPKS